MSANILPGQVVVIRDITSCFGIVYEVDETKKSVRYSKYEIPTSLLCSIPLGSTLRLEGKKFVRSLRYNASHFVGAVTKSLETDRNDVKRQKIEEFESQPEFIEHSFSQEECMDDLLSENPEDEEEDELEDKTGTSMETVSNRVKASSTFQGRTKFSQEKYIRRIAAKHCIQLEVVEASLYNVAQAYGGRDPLKLGGLRWDALGSVLNHSELAHGSRCAVFDHSLGLLTAAVLQRLHGGGHLYFLQAKGTSEHIATQLHCTTNSSEILSRFPLSIIYDCCSKEHDPEQAIIAHPFFNVTLPPNYTVEEDRLKRPNVYSRQETGRQFAAEGIDCLLASFTFARFKNQNPEIASAVLWQLFKVAESFLNPGGRLVIFSAQMNPLSDLFAHLKDQPWKWSRARMDEMMVRDMSVLPLRSHPAMDSAIQLFSGFILSVTKMNPPSDL